MKYFYFKQINLTEINKIKWFKVLLCITILLLSVVGGVRGVMVIVLRNEHGDTSSNPGPERLHFT